MGNQHWERPKDRLVQWPLQALHAAVINISIFKLFNVAIERPVISVILRSPTLIECPLLWSIRSRADRRIALQYVHFGPKADMASP